MADNARMYWLHALTPLHVGAGKGVGYIDLPIMREKVTNWPLVPGSAVKGVLRDCHAEKKTPRFDLAFGKGGDEHSNSGSLVFTDARIVCLPVRSFYGTFAWCTSPMALQRLARDLKAAGANGVPPIPDMAEGQCAVSADSALALNGQVFLEDLDLAKASNGSADGWASKLKAWLFAGENDGWREAFSKRFAIVPDNVFNFLCTTGTEVAARVKIEDDKKTVASGALWYEESLPAETILGGLVWCDRVFGGNGSKPSETDLLNGFCIDANLQIGGKATVGHGRVRCVFSSGGTKA